MNKWIGGALQIMAAFLFVLAGAEEEVLVLPAAISQLAGLAIWSRSRKSEPALPKPEAEALDARLARMEDVLMGVQTDVEKLRETRDFMEELYAAKPRELRGRAD